jgi:acyl-CoA thioesterase-1
MLAACPTLAAEPRTVVVFGDSITEGGALPKAERTNAWIHVVAREAKGWLRMVKEGKGGRPTASVKEFEAMLARHPQADVLVLALGTNDSRDLADDCVPKAVANLRTMVAKARQAWGGNLRVLIIGPPNINKNALGPTKPIANEREAKLRELGAAFAKLAAELRGDFVSLFGVVPEYSLTKDGVHPDAAGNVAIARVILPKLDK